MKKRIQAKKPGQPSKNKSKALQPSPGAAPVGRNPGDQEGVKVAQAALQVGVLGRHAVAPRRKLLFHVVLVKEFRINRKYKLDSPI